MDDYDVVLDAPQKHRDKLWERIDRNRSSGYVALNIMDDIFYQIEPLDEAIMARKNKTPQREWVGLMEDEICDCINETSALDKGQFLVEFAMSIEDKLKEKNGG